MQFVIGVADDLARRPVVETGHLVVDVFVAALVILQVDVGVDAGQDRRHQLVAHPVVRHRARAPGEVDGEAIKPDDAAAFAQRRLDGPQPATGAIGQADDLLFRDHRAFLQHAPLLLALQPVRMDEAAARLADDLVARHAEQLAHRPVGVEVMAVRVLDMDVDVERIQQRCGVHTLQYR